MYGLTRTTMTLIGAAVAGVLLWLATSVVGQRIDTNGDYWAAAVLLAAAGLAIALSQLLGGWTKWGWPRVSTSVFLFAFLPVLVVAGWVLAAHQPDANWLRDHASEWAGDLGLDGLVEDLGRFFGVLAFGVGLIFGLTFDTTGPRTERLVSRRGGAALPGSHPLESAPPPDPEQPAPEAGRRADERVTERPEDRPGSTSER